MKKGRQYPHTISYRLTDQDYLKVVRQVSGTALTPHDWCRAAVLEKLGHDDALSKAHRTLFEQLVRTHYLLVNGFQLLAEKNLSPEEWKKTRLTAKHRIGQIAARAMAELSRNMSSFFSLNIG